MEVCFLFLFALIISFHEILGETRYCSQRNKCSFNQKSSIPICYCDNECTLYEDCCKEFYESGGREKMRLYNSSMSAPETCRILTNQKFLQSGRIGAYMIDKCRQTDMKCEVESGKLDTMIPVSNGSKTYRNANCAICNQVTVFKYWKIAFIFKDDLTKDLENGKITSDDTIFNRIYKGYTGDIYFLHPPAGITPRYCPFDVYTKQKILKEPLIYQNTYTCNGTWYKNIDECLMDGCCTNMFGRCISFDLGLLPSSQGHSTAGGTTGIHAIIEFNPQKQKDFDFQKKLSFRGVHGYIIIELVEVDNRTLGSEDCIYAIMNFLATTHFRVVIDSYQYSRIRQPGQQHQIIFFMYKSTKTFGLVELQRLYELQYYIQCVDRNGNVSTDTRVSTSNIHENEELFWSHAEQSRFKNTNRYAITPSTASETCVNFSLTFEKPTFWNIPIEARCLKRKIARNTVNRGNGNRRNILGNIVYLAAIIVTRSILLVFDERN